MKVFESYLKEMARQIKPLLVINGRPILIVQIENEYGGY